MVRHFIMTYRLYTLREKHSDTKIIDIAIFDGSSLEIFKFYKFENHKNNSVEQITQEILTLLEDQKLLDLKRRVVLKVLRKIITLRIKKVNSHEQ